jgi:DivIVA domain-containing protein
MGESFDAEQAQGDSATDQALERSRSWWRPETFREQIAGGLFLFSLAGLGIGIVNLVQARYGVGGTALALAAGASLIWWLVERGNPIGSSPAIGWSNEGSSGATVADAMLPPFTRSMHGYDQQQVVDFFGGIWSKTVTEIEAARFTTRRRGFNVKEVDKALDGWCRRQGPTATVAVQHGA